MLKNTLLLTAIIAAGSLFSQQKTLSEFVQTNKATNQFTFKSNNPLTANSLVTSHKTDLGLGTSDELNLMKSEEDQLGFTHFRFQQFHKGIEVYGTQYMVHEKQGALVSSNGKLVKAISANNTFSLSKSEAVQAAINYVNAKKYMWENEQEEALLQKIKNDVTATYFPKAEPIYFDKYFTEVGSNYVTAYKVEVYAKAPVSKQEVFIDAQTGKVLHAFNKLHTAEVTGSASTKYAGTQAIQTDSLSPSSFRLREYARGGGIETYNMQEGTDYTLAVDFTDADNVWNNVNTQQDEAATDAHWAAEMTYDYFLSKHGRDSYDDAGTILLSYVHYDASYSNAFWDGTRMSYGDGDGTQYSALTSLDVGGHEIAHGVTEYSANLIYQNESGALNESFSDIFGASIEFYADFANFDWFIGEDFDIGGNGFRSMSDPNSVGDPDTYLGANWEFGPADNGGVHTNSSVQNYWFYLLTVGGSGTNDNNDAYNVTGLGIDTAAAIAYRNLTVYLTQSSNFYDARDGAIQSAADLYGACSMAVIETSKAWAAVGVGFAIEDNDLSLLSLENPTTACGLSNTEPVTIKIRNNGCLVDLIAGNTIPVAFQVDAGPVVNETITLGATFAAGDTLTYTFTATADLSLVGAHTVSSWVKYGVDAQALNDSLLSVAVEHKLQQNYDLAMVDVLSPTSGCHLSNAENVAIAIQFLGCDSLIAGTTIDVEYKVNAAPVVNETITLANTIYAEDTLYYTFTATADLSANGTHTLDAWSAHTTDLFNTNDTITGLSIKHPYPLFDTDTVTFEDNVAVLDSTILWDNIESNASVSNASAASGTYALRLTGGDPLNAATTPDLDTANFWNNNIEFATTAKFCVDATGWTGVWMQFDLRQTSSKAYALQLGQPVLQSSSLRVVVNGSQIGGTYNPASEVSDPFTAQFADLSAYAGTQFEVVFESRMGFSETADPLSGFPFNSEGDNAYIDNILFTQIPLSVEEQEQIENIAVYPNPTNGVFNMRFTANDTQGARLELYDVLGNTIQNKNIPVVVGYNNLTIDITNQPNGIYIAKLVSEKGSYVARVIKK